MEIDKEKRTLNASIDKWLFEADYISDESIQIFLYSADIYAFGNKFVGYYNSKTQTIRPLYYNTHMDYRGKEPTKRQFDKIQKYCNKLIASLKS